MQLLIIFLYSKVYTRTRIAPWRRYNSFDNCIYACGIYCDECMYHTLYDKKNMLFRLALFIVYMLYIILSYRFVFIFLCAYGMVYFQYGEFSCKNSKILLISSKHRWIWPLRKCFISHICCDLCCLRESLHNAQCNISTNRIFLHSSTCF